jgi:hypothetical protein
MVRWIVLVPLALSLCSCGGARSLPEAPWGIAPFDEGAAEGLAGATEDPEAAKDDFEAIERLRENPVDPSRASLETLLSIPGLPPALAARVAAETSRGAPGRWIDRLTPPERAALRRFGDLLVLPDERPRRVTARATAAGIASGRPGDEEGYASASSPRWKALWRTRRAGPAGGTAWYAAGECLSGAMRVHAGNLVPDFGMGLVCGLSRPSPLSSGPRPLYAPRGVVGSTSFSSVVVRGGAAELWRGPARALVFGGRPAAFDGARFERAGPDVRGARLGLRLGGAEVGLACASGLSAPGTMLRSIDGLWRGGAMDLGVEAAFPAGGEPAYLAAVSFRSPRTKGTLSIHSVPPGIGGKLAAPGGRSIGPSSSESALSASAEQALAERLRVRGSLDRYERATGFDIRRRRTTKVELERVWRRVSGKLSWSSAAEGRERVAPYPGAASPSLERTASLGAASTLRISKGARVRLTLRHVRGPLESGLLVSPGMTLSLFGGRVQSATSIAVYRAFRGTPTCWFYEPALQGEFPLAVASSDRSRCASVITIGVSTLRVSAKVELDERRPPDLSLQAILVRRSP